MCTNEVQQTCALYSECLNNEGTDYTICNFPLWKLWKVLSV